MFDDQRGEVANDYSAHEKVNKWQRFHRQQLGEFTIQLLSTNILHWWCKVIHEVGKWSDTWEHTSCSATLVEEKDGGLIFRKPC